MGSSGNPQCRKMAKKEDPGCWSGSPLPCMGRSEREVRGGEWEVSGTNRKRVTEKRLTLCYIL